MGAFAGGRDCDAALSDGRNLAVFIDGSDAFVAAVPGKFAFGSVGRGKFGVEIIAVSGFKQQLAGAEAETCQRNGVLNHFYGAFCVFRGIPVGHGGDNCSAIVEGCNQTVALPEKDWGYASYGLQEEGYLASWWAVDDPMFSADTGFGYRLKGEGNKTCFSWIPAVAVKGYWSLLDRFGTCDFDEIKDRLSR